MDELLAGLAGVALAAVLGWTAAYVGYVARRNRELHLAALVCRDRLAKIEYVRSQLPASALDEARAAGWRNALKKLGDGDWRGRVIADELHNLGGNVDRYLEAIAPVSRPGLRTLHLRIYHGLTELLMTQDLEQVEPLVKELDAALEPVGWIKRSRRSAPAAEG